MAASTTSSFPVPATTALASAAIEFPAHCRRRITPEAGHALEILGHAIEYLSDELVHRGGDISAHTAEVEAIQLLMARNRQVYYACPAIPTLRERLHAWFRGYRL
jgi:hypothetical protein